MTWQEEAKKMAQGIRKRALGVTLAKNGSYLSQALSSAEMLATLFTKVMVIGESRGEMNPEKLPDIATGHFEPKGGGRYWGEETSESDRFYLSPSHYAIAVYAALAEMGRLSQEALMTYNDDGSIVSMISEDYSPGFDLTTGSFGQCISQAAGIAMARKLRGETGLVFVFLSDGELQEGQIWEAMQAMAFHKIDNLVVLVDVNGQQVDGYTKDVMNVEPLDKRFESFGAKVAVVDGHDVDALYAATQQDHANKPLVILCYTDSVRGVPLLEKRKPKLHFVRTTAEEKVEFEAFYQQM